MTNRNPAQSLQENAIAVFGPRLIVQLLPKYLRHRKCYTEKFKFDVDKFIEHILDEPKMSNYVTAAGSNSMLDQLTYLRAQGIYECGVVTRPQSSLSCFETTPSIQVSKYTK